MKHLRVRLIRCCPKCNSFDVRRSHRKGLLEALIQPLFLLRPFRCNACQFRHVNFFFCQKISPEANEVDGLG
jgi:alkylhydroperoxidase family enzyme